MIRLKYNPFVGSSIPVTLSFKDSLGVYYVPLELTYSFLALNSDKTTYQAVDDLYEEPLSVASIVNLVIPSSATHTITDTELNRKIVVSWTAYVDGQTTSYIDEIDFTLQPQPTLYPVPSTPTVTPTALTVESIKYNPVNTSNLCLPNSTVSITFNQPVNSDTILIDDAVLLDNASITGSLDNTGCIWSYTFTDLSTGNHSIVLASTITAVLGGTFAGQTISFTSSASIASTSSITLTSSSAESISGTETSLNEALTGIVTAVKSILPPVGAIATLDTTVTNASDIYGSGTWLLIGTITVTPSGTSTVTSVALWQRTN